MKVFDFNRIAINDYPYTYLLEVAFRSVFTFFLAYIFLRWVGRRGVKQMTLFELIIILTLGSAAGDVALNQDSPLLPVIITFITITGLYRFFTTLINKSTRLQIKLEGKPILLVKEGVLHWENTKKQSFAYEEFIMELREKGIDHLGQVRLAILEIDGNLSVYFYKDEDVKPGLSVLPFSMVECCNTIESEGYYSCTCCSYTCFLQKGDDFNCPRCQSEKWTVASQEKRIT
ncbi:DUF421 domain-containing protein [Serratia odorifera]|uniref:YetF C-terminal domain-containing protein n=2 Tax=Serratia odorifera TaxID=618 RepID=D4E4N9_SEROD|nr:DUF421 domain-containing protein [Serratia odorifera]EFE95085.1 hypothetical protein HMPREF0758_3139 [Serratia odorifera DSM 4582]PNK89956.1 DUF421 domain-containing protein [Serratia odorifera]RII70459.1 DUF421 domain-containing protein [Serratia odorifera]VDZ61494.1 Protein of uncharacterised function (DUF421) [Serratia odorifera]